VRPASPLCAALALVVCAWFALGARQAVDTQRANAIVSQGSTASAAQVRRVASLVHAARFLNPDEQPNVLLGQIEIERGDLKRARRILGAVTKGEPQNVQGWRWLAVSSGAYDALYYSAGLHIRELAPPVPAQ
jgi:hypothetical protein